MAAWPLHRRAYRSPPTGADCSRMASPRRSGGTFEEAADRNPGSHYWRGNRDAGRPHDHAGLADLKGHVGISFDDGAWMAARSICALMFIGPFTVYLGGLLGPRRILLGAATLFTVICAFLPLIHSYSLLMAALVLAGLTSGTFYPLTLTFALRNIPLRFLPFTICALRERCGWRGEHRSIALRMFPGSSFVALDVLEFGADYAADDSLHLLRNSGQRRPSRRNQARRRVSRGFLYASAGFAMLFAALDQGQRLDWWRSGLFMALFVGGMFFLVAALGAAAEQCRIRWWICPTSRQWNTRCLASRCSVPIFVCCRRSFWCRRFWRFTGSRPIRSGRL